MPGTVQTPPPQTFITATLRYLNRKLSLFQEDPANESHCNRGVIVRSVNAFAMHCLQSAAVCNL